MKAKVTLEKGKKIKCTKKKTLFYKIVKFYEEKRGFTKIGAIEYAKKMSRSMANES